MCVIVAMNKGVRPSKTILENCYDNNPDGWGLMWNDKDEKGNPVIKHIKRVAPFKEFWAEFEKIPADSAVGAHFRIRTHGPTNDENCHPFKISDNMFMMHNGVINVPTPNKNYSDTWHYVEHELKPWLKNSSTSVFRSTVKKVDPATGVTISTVEQSVHMKFIEDCIGYSKLLFLDKFGNFAAANTKLWHELEIDVDDKDGNKTKAKIYLSNSTSHTAKYRSAYSSTNYFSYEPKTGEVEGSTTHYYDETSKSWKERPPVIFVDNVASVGEWCNKVRSYVHPETNALVKYKFSGHSSQQSCSTTNSCSTTKNTPASVTGVKKEEGDSDKIANFPNVPVVDTLVYDSVANVFLTLPAELTQIIKATFIQASKQKKPYPYKWNTEARQLVPVIAGALNLVQQRAARLRKESNKTPEKKTRDDSFITIDDFGKMSHTTQLVYITENPEEIQDLLLMLYYMKVGTVPATANNKAKENLPVVVNSESNKN